MHAPHSGSIEQVATAELDERALGDRSQSPAALVSLLARAKAKAIQAKLDPQKAVLVTCDQVVVHQGVIREKPLDEQEVRTGPARAVSLGVTCLLLSADKETAEL